ncbi:Gfo/Idh/MocA family protein [Pararhodobacter zhoushanensis]|uniref:Gfo/Idh/MocA family oxidoreductase n=1 Tax=Pararhodobacter zhoushanensis TaxID=2479545 RepID=A0ABT3GY71_9RHOB|nr:Gfo/Idh/MocA family oxidoreductase [Pararhodobacter zhoushanensis]MCW1932514.1 Gfo/Idh/MocA family oxidoreductase [Pararhodobacter zhoushanensis]
MDIALIGIGKIARDAHVPAIAASPDWDLAATVSRQGRVEGVQDYPDLDTLFAQRPDIRVVSLCLPPVPRFAYAVQALSAGRHVMLEKPPGATLAEVHALEALARAHRVSLFATWHSREAAGVAAAKSWLAGRALRSLRVVWKEDVRRWHPGQDWIWEPGGMGVFDPGINALSIVTEILPVPIHVSSAVLEVPENRQTPIAATLEFFHPAGAKVSAVFDWRHEGVQSWTIEAETDAGQMRLTKGGAHLSVDGVEGMDSADPTLDGEYPRLYAKFATLIQRGGSNVDLAPLRLVADAHVLGRRVAAAPFTW